MLETRFEPSKAPSLSRMSPDGRWITSVGAEGADGDVNEYCVADECTLISRNGVRLFIVKAAQCSQAPLGDQKASEESMIAILKSQALLDNLSA